MKPTSPDRAARVEQLMDEFRRSRQRTLLRRALRLWRRAEADQRFLAFERPPERVH